MGKTHQDDHALLQSLVEAHPEPFALIDEHYTIVACNRKYADAYTDLTPDDIVGMKCHEVSHKSTDRCDLNGEECPLERVFESRHPVQVVHQHFDRDRAPYYVNVHGSPIRAQSGGVRYFGEAMAPISRVDDLDFDEERLIGCCPSFMNMLDNLSLVAQTDLPVLIHGETGTGKELAALFLHRKSRRAEREFVTIDCTTLSDEMFVAELFGHEAGAFTGAAAARKGLVEVADGGTLFLDEFGEISPEIQTKLLRVLDRGTFRRLGNNRERKANFRLICATNRNLAQRVEAGAFRADLFYRVNSMQITLPALRHRKEDIPQLVDFFLRKLMPANLAPLISDGALEALLRYDFPGNVRELKNTLERAVVVARGGTLEPQHLPAELRHPQPSAKCDDGTDCGYHDGCTADDPGIVRAALARFGGNRRKTAAFLKISERTLYRRLKALGLT
ncbi:sigma-54 interaction domain-containing protein [Thioalkalivibrio paradoxus]|uniref:sigma-54 interaction domain-containing protein n=1 Tax=Thioalkalivibrio paradoxus TaxID=108010 RepID=UPI00031CEC0F|nr:sigma 54-interacting transcriptional regulator [Thioalkalivibrio paradoxus]